MTQINNSSNLIRLNLQQPATVNQDVDTAAVNEATSTINQVSADQLDASWQDLDYVSLNNIDIQRNPINKTETSITPLEDGGKIETAVKRDTEGNVISQKETRYDKDGKVVNYKLSEYQNGVLRKETFYTAETGGVDNRTQNSTREVYYDEAGNKTKSLYEQRWNDTGKLYLSTEEAYNGDTTFVTTSLYDDNEKIYCQSSNTYIDGKQVSSKQERYDADGKLTNLYTAWYNDGKLTSSKDEYYDSEGNITTERTAMCDADGKIISLREIQYDANGTMTSVRSLVYNSDGSPASSKMEYLDGEGRVTAEETQTYDEEGNLSYSSIKEVDTLGRVVSEEACLYEDGNLKSKHNKTYSSNGSYQYTIVQYDENGDVVLETTKRYDADGNELPALGKVDIDVTEQVVVERPEIPETPFNSNLDVISGFVTKKLEE